MNSCPQFPLMRDAVRAFGLIPIEQEGFEADDLIATYSRVALDSGADVSIIAGDKDMMQLVRPGVVMFDPMPGNERRIGAAEVLEKFGVPPEKVPDVQALIGDPTDNVPGVPGIGVKTAAQLIGEYGDLETLLSRAPEIKQEKRRQSLIEHAEQARMSKRLVLLDDHVELKYQLDDLPLDGRDPKALIAFLKAMEFTSLTKRVGEATGIDPNAIDPDPALAPARAADKRSRRQPPRRTNAAGWSRRGACRRHRRRRATRQPPRRGNCRSVCRPIAGDRSRCRPAAEGATPLTLVRERLAEAREGRSHRLRDDRRSRALARFIAEATDQGYVAIDLVLSSPDPMIAALIGVSLALAPNRAAYVPLGHRAADDLPRAGRRRSCPDRSASTKRSLCSSRCSKTRACSKSATTSRHDTLVLERHGIALAPIDDVMLMSYVLDAGPRRPRP